MLYSDYYESPLGKMKMYSDGYVLTGLVFEGQKYAVCDEAASSQDGLFIPVRKWLDIYFSGGVPDFIPPIALSGTPFRMEVWKLLLEIPYGSTVTYGMLAEKVASATGMERMSAQAVGGAVGHNPISIIVPCHRVVGADGSLTGYAGGLWRKEKLLEIEKAVSKI